MPIRIDSAQHASKTEAPPQTQSIPPRHSLFHTIAMRLGAEWFPPAPLRSRGGCTHTGQQPYEAPLDILARRHPYLYIHSLSG